MTYATAVNKVMCPDCHQPAEFMVDYDGVLLEFCEEHAKRRRDEQTK
jgi:hypothetical protein